MKVLFDTNVFLAAFLTEGVCAKLLLRARKRQFTLVSCPFIIHEFEHILFSKFSASKQEKENAIALITEAAQDLVHPAETLSGISRDKDDDNVLACALGGAVDYLVTGDKDLLVLKVFRGIHIITPRDFELFFDY
jgi:uncharacterized protein